MTADVKDNDAQPNLGNHVEKSKPRSEKIDTFKQERATIIMQHPDGTVEKRAI